LHLSCAGSRDQRRTLSQPSRPKAAGAGGRPTSGSPHLAHRELINDAPQASNPAGASASGSRCECSQKNLPPGGSAAGREYRLASRPDEALSQQRNSSGTGPSPLARLMMSAVFINFPCKHLTEYPPCHSNTGARPAQRSADLLFAACAGCGKSPHLMKVFVQRHRRHAQHVRLTEISLTPSFCMAAQLLRVLSRTTATGPSRACADRAA